MYGHDGPQIRLAKLANLGRLNGFKNALRLSWSQRTFNIPLPG
jgi:hypothetical protein